MYQLDQYTVSLLHFEDGFQDETGRAWTANGGATTSTAGAPIGSTSAYFNGTTDANISTPATSDLQFGDDPFTIDFWMFPINTDVQQHPIGMIPGWRMNGGWMIYLNNDGTLGFYRGSNEFDDLVETSFGAVRLSSWSHIAVVKETAGSTKIKIYVNGVKKAEGNLSSGTILDTSVDLRIGRGHETWNGVRPFKGYIDEVRISKGIARWTEDFMESVEDSKNGKDGKSAYEIAVDHGFVGTEVEWLASLKGEQGPKGDPSDSTGDISTPQIYFKNTDFNEFMRGFTRPHSLNVFDGVYYEGPGHGQGTNGNFQGGVLIPNGKVILVPWNSTTISIYDPIANTYTVGPKHGQDDSWGGTFGGGVLAPNGKIILVPRNSKKIGIYDPIANTYTDGPEHGYGARSGSFEGGVLAPNGKVIFVPNESPTIGIYDPNTNTYTNGPVHGQNIGNGGFRGGVLTPNGKVILVPWNSTTIGIYDPITNTYTNGPAHGQGTTAFYGGVLAPNGKVILVPCSSQTIGIYDPIANTYTSGPKHGQGSSVFFGGVLAPSGKVIFMAARSNIGIYDPIANTYTTGPAHGQDLLGGAFKGGVLTPNGKVILVPSNSANIGIYELFGCDSGIGYCLHPYLNKF